MLNQGRKLFNWVTAQKSAIFLEKNAPILQIPGFIHLACLVVKIIILQLKEY